MSTKPEIRATRQPHIAETVVFVNGIPACGKTLISAIVSSLDRVELEKYDYPLEYICQLHFLGRIKDDAAQTMIRLLSDLDLYHIMQSRETNFRYSDLSSAFRNPRPWRYFLRLFGPGDRHSLKRIQAEKPILQIVTHNLLSIGEPVFAALGERVRFIEVVRHPLYMLKQWRLYIHRYGTDVRDFTVWHRSCEEALGQDVPWFAKGWEKTYLDCNPMDRVILSIDRLLQWSDALLAGLSREAQSRVLVIPFERFVLNPEPFMHQLTAFLGTREIPQTRREMRKQKVPRTMIADGIDLGVYRDNGWKPPQGRDESKELEIRRSFAAAEASQAGLAVLDRLCREYEKRYPWVNAPITAQV